VSLVVDELLTVPGHMNSPPVSGWNHFAQLLVLCVMFCTSLFVFLFMKIYRCKWDRSRYSSLDIYRDKLSPTVIAWYLCKKQNTYLLLALFTLFVIICVWWCQTHIVLCFLFCLSSSCVLCTQFRQFLWIVHSWLHLRFSLTFS
jgi:hypothetical protein